MLISVNRIESNLVIDYGDNNNNYYFLLILSKPLGILDAEVKK